jgi:HAD superfamily hydrolase (TIGR01549 family)
MIIVLFDLEGTLVKSMEDDKEAICEFKMKTASKLVELGIPTSGIEGIEGSALMRNRALDIVDQRFNKKEARRFHHEMDKFLKSFELRWALQSRLFPETLSVLHRLRKLCKIGLVTNTSKEAAYRMLSMHGIDCFFNVIITREDVKKLKPDPEGLLLALRKLGGQNFFYVGDSSSHDSLAAKRAGGISIIVRRNPLKALKFEPDFVVNSLEEIIDIVKESKRWRIFSKVAR